ncbi:hypothetical protein MMC18_004793, partial [Xylographa bjoerkii]|nr:hypothetical protein [Xylographa bjoerkii]
MPPSRTSPPPSPPPKPLGLTPAQQAFFSTNGYLLLPSALPPSTITALLAETQHLLTTFPLATHPLTKFSTGETAAHVSDDYFLTSGDQIRFFFEEDAFSPSGTLTKPQALAINKIGHYLHALSAPFRAATLTPAHAAIARDLGFRDPRVLQSMVICKQPEIGGRVPPHQDSAFLYTDPPSAVGFWLALEDATPANGCLSFAAGSHRRAGVGRRFVRRAEGGGTEFVAVEGARFPEGMEVEEGDGRQEEEEEEEEEEVYTLGEVKAGTLVLIHGNLLHKSERNRSSKGRMIYTFHVIEGESEYDARNWLQPPEGGFTRLTIKPSNAQVINTQDTLTLLMPCAELIDCDGAGDIVVVEGFGEIEDEMGGGWLDTGKAAAVLEMETWTGMVLLLEGKLGPRLGEEASGDGAEDRDGIDVEIEGTDSTGAEGGEDADIEVKPTIVADGGERDEVGTATVGA